MKIRNGFVSNSSSTSFLITNTSDESKSLVDFVEENPQLVDMYNDQYGGDGFGSHLYSHAQLLSDAKAYVEIEGGYTLKPKSYDVWIFGDEDGDAIGCVYDYILREGGKSESFQWSAKESLR